MMRAGRAAIRSSSAAPREGSTGNDVPIILRDTIGLNVKQVVGYPDSGALYLAIERGEVHGRITDLSSVRAIKPDWLKPNSGFQVLVQFARDTRHPDFPNVPTARELARNEAARLLIELTEIPVQAVAAVRGAAGDPARARQGAAARVCCHPSGPAISGGSRKTAGRREPGHGRGRDTGTQAHRKRAAAAARLPAPAVCGIEGMRGAGSGRMAFASPSA